jgi:DNA replication protein DnaC
MRFIAHQIPVTLISVHRDLAEFDFDASSVGNALTLNLAGLSFTQQAQNSVVIGGPGTDRSHLAKALGISGMTHHAKRGKWPRFYNGTTAFRHRLI